MPSPALLEAKRTNGGESAQTAIQLCVPASQTDEAPSPWEHSERSREILTFLNSMFDSFDHAVGERATIASD